MVQILPDLNVKRDREVAPLEQEELAAVTVVFMRHDDLADAAAVGVEEHQELVFLDHGVDCADDADYGVAGGLAPRRPGRGEVFDFHFYGAVGVDCVVVRNDFA